MFYTKMPLQKLESIKVLAGIDNKQIEHYIKTPMKDGIEVFMMYNPEAKQLTTVYEHDNKIKYSKLYGFVLREIPDAYKSRLTSRTDIMNILRFTRLGPYIADIIAQPSVRPKSIKKSTNIYMLFAIVSVVLMLILFYRWARRKTIITKSGKTRDTKKLKSDASKKIKSQSLRQTDSKRSSAAQHTKKLLQLPIKKEVDTKTILDLKNFQMLTPSGGAIVPTFRIFLGQMIGQISQDFQSIPQKDRDFILDCIIAQVRHDIMTKTLTADTVAKRYLYNFIESDSGRLLMRFCKEPSQASKKQLRKRLIAPVSKFIIQEPLSIKNQQQQHQQQHQQHQQQQQTGGAIATKTFYLMTWNIRWNQKEKKTAYMRRFREFIQITSEITDIYCLQEMNPDWTDDMIQVLDGFGYEFSLQDDLPDADIKKRTRIGIAYRQPFTNVVQLVMPLKSQTRSQTVMGADVSMAKSFSSGQRVRPGEQGVMSASGKHFQILLLQHDNQVFLIGNYHGLRNASLQDRLHLLENTMMNIRAIRADYNVQSRRSLGAANVLSCTHTIIAGDFNIESSIARTAFPKLNIYSEKDDMIDYLISPDVLQNVDISVLDDKYGSDHAPVWFTIQI